MKLIRKPELKKNSQTIAWEFEFLKEHFTYTLARESALVKCNPWHIVPIWYINHNSARVNHMQTRLRSPTSNICLEVVLSASCSFGICDSFQDDAPLSASFSMTSRPPFLSSFRFPFSHFLCPKVVLFQCIFCRRAGAGKNTVSDFVSNDLDIFLEIPFTRSIQWSG